jgi:hypothetical protein
MTLTCLQSQILKKIALETLTKYPLLFSQKVYSPVGFFLVWNPEIQSYFWYIGPHAKFLFPRMNFLNPPRYLRIYLRGVLNPKLFVTLEPMQKNKGERKLHSLFGKVGEAKCIRKKEKKIVGSCY